MRMPCCQTWRILRSTKDMAQLAVERGHIKYNALIITPYYNYY